MLLLLQQRLFCHITYIKIVLEWSQMWNTCTFSQRLVVWVCLFFSLSECFRRIFICFLEQLLMKKQKPCILEGNIFTKHMFVSFSIFLRSLCWKVTFFVPHIHLQTSLCILKSTFIENPLKHTHEHKQGLSCHQSVTDHDDDVGINLHVSQECLFMYHMYFFTQILHYYKKFIMTFRYEKGDAHMLPLETQKYAQVRWLTYILCKFFV